MWETGSLAGGIAVDTIGAFVGIDGTAELEISTILEAVEFEHHGQVHSTQDKGVLGQLEFLAEQGGFIEGCAAIAVAEQQKIFGGILRQTGRQIVVQLLLGG